MDEGWIKLHRRFVEWEWYTDSKMVHLFIHLLLMANHEDKKWKGEIITRGQVLTSLDKLAKSTGLSKQNIRTCLANLQKTHEVNKESTHKETIITICNFDRYQVREDGIQHGANTNLTNDQHTTNTATNKNEKNIYSTITNAPAREESPAEDWRFVSSVRRSILDFDKEKIAAHKKSLFREEAERLSQKVGMNRQQLEAFVRWWTESSPGSEKIKAEFEVTFDMESRMTIWVERDKPSSSAPASKSRMDALQDDLNFIHNYFNGNPQSNTTPDEQW